MAWAVPLFTGVVSLGFAAALAARRAGPWRPQDVAWTLGLAGYGVTSLVEAWVSVRPWTEPLYRAYFPLSAALVGALGAGTVYLVARDRAWGHAFAAFVVACTVLSAGAQFRSPFDAAALLEGPDGAARPVAEAGAELGAALVPFSNPARWANLLLNVVGGAVLVGGALWSWWRTREAGLLLIGTGGLLPLVGGSSAAAALWNGRVLMQFLGMAALFVGYLALSRRAPLRAAWPAREGAP